jgi:hypothetical protein
MMKKVINFCIFVLMLSTVLSAQPINTKEKQINNFEYKYINKSDFNDPPDWADGEFNGTWGISLLGLPLLELGWVYGYFSAIEAFGKLEGYFAEWKDDEPKSFISGYIILYNMIGYVGEIDNPDNGTFFMGIGTPNENGEFYYRISLILGPNWYMTGTWREI